jgi:acetyl esterase/lipase
MQDQFTRPTFAEDGTVAVPAFALPPSELASAEARAMQALRARLPGGAPPTDLEIAAIRAGLEQMLAPQVEQMRQLYPVEISELEIAGVPTRVVTPPDGSFDDDIVLINLHGGAFSMCAGACALLESIPIAALGRFKVITVDYRMAPEFYHPAALEDVEVVYRALLENYVASRVGVFGCSAGGALTAQLAAWLPARGLPEPGAIGIFGAGGVRFVTGDSAWIAAFVDGSFPPPGVGGDMTHGYFTHADMLGPVVSPALHPEVLADFPPALIITGTRAMDMSPAIVTNSALIKAGVPSTLIVGEGMGHCYIYQSNLPEARDAHQAIVDFFRRNLMPE